MKNLIYIFFLFTNLWLSAQDNVKIQIIDSTKIKAKSVFGIDTFGTLYYATANNTFNKKMDEVEEEVEKEEGDGNIMFGNPISRLDGNQIVINSERLILSAKTKELILYGKGKFGLSTDNEFTINSVKRMVMVTATHYSVVSPTIHLGAYITRRHPVLKGNNTTAWLAGLCDWLSRHTHHDPYITTSKPAQQGQLAGLRARLPTLLSTRVFIDG